MAGVAEIRWNVEDGKMITYMHLRNGALMVDGEYLQMNNMEDTRLRVSWLIAVSGLTGPLPGLLE